MTAMSMLYVITPKDLINVLVNPDMPEMAKIAANQVFIEYQVIIKMMI